VIFYREENEDHGERGKVGTENGPELLIREGFKGEDKGNAVLAG